MLHYMESSIPSIPVKPLPTLSPVQALLGAIVFILVVHAQQQLFRTPGRHIIHYTKGKYRRQKEYTTKSLTGSELENQFERKTSSGRHC